MKYIDYDDKLANKVYKKFYEKHGAKYGPSNAWGYAAEALVRQYYGHPVDDNWYKFEEGNGWDYVDSEGYKIDVKNHKCSYYYFSTLDNMWIVHDYKGLNADCYLCTCLVSLVASKFLKGRNQLLYLCLPRQFPAGL